MKNKFLNGARVAGVMLALVLLGASSALAVDVTINLADLTKIRGNVTTQIGATAADRNTEQASWNASLRAANRFAVWPAGVSTTADAVYAEFAWKTASPAHYDSVLTITAGSNVDKVIITGAADAATTGAKGLRIQQIVFAGGKSGGTEIEWAGGTVVGIKTTGTNLQPNPADVDAFLVKTGSTIAGIHLYSGSIESFSKYLIKGVGLNQAGATPTAAEIKSANLIGNPNASGANDNLTLKGHGSEATVEVLYGRLKGGTEETPIYELVSINPPNKGTYLIESDGVAIVPSVATGTVVIGKTSDHGSGVLTINAWKNTTTAAASATAGAAIRAANIKINGNDIAKVKKLVINSKGKFALQATTGVVHATDVEIQHQAAAGTVGAAVVSAQGAVDLNYVKVTNGTAAGNVAGLIVSTNGAITILGGSFYPSANPKGGTALSTLGGVKISGAKISGAGTAASAGFVVEADNVTLEATSTDSAVVAWAGTGAQVGGISAKSFVDVKTAYGAKAEVRAVGAGTGIYVKLPVDYPGAPTVEQVAVKLKGNASTSVIVNVASGQAILVENKTEENDAGAKADVTIEDAIITRSATNAALPLVDVQGGDVWVRGTTLDRMRMSAGSNVAISASVDKAYKVCGGSVTVNGGKIEGASGAIVGKQVQIEQWKGGYWVTVDEEEETETEVPAGTPDAEWRSGETDGFGTLTTVITSTSGITVSSINSVRVNNGFASLLHTGNVADNPATGVRAAVIYSLLGRIDIFNLDSIRAANATALLTVEKEQGIAVYAGRIKSTASYALNSSGDVFADWTPYTTGYAADDNWAPTLVVDERDDAALALIEDGEIELSDAVSTPAVIVGKKRNKIEITTNGTTSTVSAIYAPYPQEGPTVKIGDAIVQSTATGGSAAVVVNKGSVTVAHKDARIFSQSGNGIKVQDADVTLNAGDVVSNPTSGTFAGIWVVNGHVSIGDATETTTEEGETVVTPITTETDVIGPSRVTSNGSLAVYLEGNGVKDVTVGYFGVLSVKGANATAGMIKVTKKNTVTVKPNAKLISTGSQAFAIEAEEGDVAINGGRIESMSSKQAISTKGGEILISGSVIGSADRDIDGGVEGTRITGNEGVLVRAIKNATTGRAGAVRMRGGFIYNKYGTGIKADDSLFIDGGEVVTDKDTAVTAGTASAAGLVSIGEGYAVWGGNAAVEAEGTAPHIWAAAQYAKATPIAVSARMVRMAGGLVEANTIKSSADNTSTYPDSKATGILLKTGPGTPVFKVKNKAKVVAHGANTAIDCKDSTVTLEITGEAEPEAAWLDFRISVNGDHLGWESVRLPGSVSIKAGDNGIAIKSVGEVKVDGLAPINEDSRAEEGLVVGAYIASGNGVNARAIVMPVPANSNKHKDLTLENGFVEAGSDGAIAIDADAKAIVRVDHSVVLVRHLSTAISGKGGVYIDAGYVEVLATENNNVGTAVLGRNIRISGGQEGEDADKSEIHSKGIAVKDNVEGAVVQVTGTIHMSGTVASNLKVGASVVSDTGILTMGSEKSRNLWKLSTASEKTIEDEKGKALVIPAGVTIEVGDNGSRLGTEKFDTVKVAGVVTTVGKHAGAQFVNSGRVLVEKGGNVKFNKADPASFKNDNGIIVLKTGSILDDSVLVHDTGKLSEKGYTFLKWAKILSGDTAYAIGSRGPGNVVVPPMYATLYGNQRAFVDEEDMDEEGVDYWTATSSRSDSVYTAKYIKYPLDRRYKPYFQTADFLAKGDFTLGGTGTVQVDEDGTVMLTEAGTFNRVATMKNEAGEGTKTYTHIVNRVDLNRIIQNQTNEPIFFDGYFFNKDVPGVSTKRVVGRDGEDTVLVREGGVEVKYTGNTAKLLDGIKGVAVEGYTDLETDKAIYYSGLGVHTFWYRGVGETFYPLTSSVPTNVGTYEVLASFAQGNNFEAVPSDERSIVPIGTVTVVEGDIESVFGKKDNESYQILVDLEAKVAKNGVKAILPSVIRFGAKYDSENIEISGTGEAALVGLPALPDSVLTFSVNSSSEVGNFVEFKVTIINTAEPPNLAEGNYITIRVRFLSKEDMKETKPSYITVNYRDEKLTGLLVGTTYTINGETFAATSSDTPIKEDWVGTTLSVVALPGVNSYKTQSDAASIVIGIRPAVNDSLRNVKGDSASTAISFDGRLRNTSTSMEYKLASDTTWKPASAVVTSGLKAGTYQVRLAPTSSSFPSEAITVQVPTGILGNDRVIPVKDVTAEAAIAPVAKVVATFTAGPSPVSKSAGKVSFFSAKQVKSGSLYIFDAAGNAVAKVKAKSGTKEIASWNLKDKKGAIVATGSYVAKGKLVGKDGKAETVSAIFSVAK